MTLTMRRLLYCWLVFLSACDPVHDDAIDALGGEVNGVGRGPEHRPGQPCLLCHDGALGSPQEFSVAGTVFVRPNSTEPAKRATVELHGADDSVFEVGTNSAGNFYVSPRQLAPAFPLEVEVHYQGQTAKMHSLIGREGSCAGCHADPAGPGSPGHVYALLEDGGVPP